MTDEERKQKLKAPILDYFKDINYYMNSCMAYDSLNNMLENLIDEVEERPHGEWIFNEDGNYECSECGIAWKDMPVKDEKPVFKACPWCGADMRGDEA